MDPLVLWQARQIRRLLNLVDRLPRNSFYSEAVANDPEHMAMLVKAAGPQSTKDVKPPMSSWSPEVEATTQVVDAVRALIAITIMANAKKGSKKPDVTPAPRPGTVVSEVEREQKRKTHRRLVSMLLPDRGEEAAE